MPHRRSSPPHFPHEFLSFHPLSRLSQLFEHGLGSMLAGFRSTYAHDEQAPRADMAQIREPIPQPLLKAEVESLPAEQHLVTSGQFSVHCARAEQFPWSLQEIGRLRELTFRAAGEGTDPSQTVNLSC